MRTRTQTPVPDPMIGRTMLEFRIEEQLAAGGMGAVYLARHVLLPSTLKVIKVLLPEYAANPVIRQRFHREAEVASKLKHERILGIDNFGTLDDGQLFLMIPYLDGQPLDAYLRSRGGRLSPHRALHLVVQLCDALDHAHALGIIHRDLKPGNVYVVATNANPYALKLLDFGIAKLLGSPEGGPRTASGVAIGTPSYMAVEQYEHADEVTHLADLYSLAIVVWELVTGARPWQHPDPALLYFQHRTVIPDRPPADVMPPAWTEVLLAALSVEPASRPQSARELAVALASALPVVGQVPSGAEILAGLAPHFVRKAAPDAETVCNASEIDRLGPLLWPPRETAPDAPCERPLPAADAAPAAEAPAMQTTLSAATGVTRPPAVRSRRARWKLALAAIGTTTVAALAAGGIAASISSEDGSTPAPASSPSVTPPPRTNRSSAPVTGESRATAPEGGGPANEPARERAPNATLAAPALIAPSARASPVAPAPSTAPAARSSSGTRSDAKPAGTRASVVPRPGGTPAIDPDDVSGPEE